MTQEAEIPWSKATIMSPPSMSTKLPPCQLSPWATSPRSCPTLGDTGTGWMDRNYFFPSKETKEESGPAQNSSPGSVGRLR